MAFRSRHEAYLDQLPAEWPIVSVSELGTIHGGSTPSREVPRYWGGEIPWVTPGELTNLRTKYLAETAERTTQAGLDSCGARLLPPETLLVTTRATLGAVALLKTGTATNQGFKAVVFDKVASPDFYYHLFQRLGSELQRRASGTTFLEIPGREFKAICVPKPPLPEQRVIAQILDTVDEAVRKTEELIAKLKQVKQGLLHDLLTRGIDENGELRDPERHPEHFKDSPLGRIPREWGVAPLGKVSQLVTSGSRGWARYYADNGPSFIRIGNLTREHINLRVDNLVHVRPPPSSEGKRTQLAPRDLLISITAYLGIIGVVPDWIGEAYVNQHIALIRIDPSMADARWLGHYLSGDQAQRRIRRLDDPGAKAGLNLPTVRAIQVCLPPRREQEAVVERLDAIDSGIGLEERFAAKLRLLKTGLMEDLLTGRVRVTPLLESPP